MNLVIVESPTKARKLAGYLGKSYQVEASVGHIRDLPSSELGVDVDKNFQPTYEVNPDKTKVVSNLKKLASKADMIYLATDPDREGEAIAWHIKYLLQEGKSSKADSNFLRATFHEITKPAVMAAIEKPGKINTHLVDAQQARRIVDRLVGYKISPVLWRKIRRGLSAGRVQSVALRLIVEREREIEAFVPDEYWEVDVAVATQEGKFPEIFVEGKPIFDLPAEVLIARVIKIDKKEYAPKSEGDVKNLAKALHKAGYKVLEVEKKERKRESLPPFTTSTLQQVAATRLGFTSKQTMRLAQQLYEEGLITYHRTDSVTLSSAAIEMARGFIAQEYGSGYVPAQPRVFRSSSKNAQEAHEAVRVTDAKLMPEGIYKESSKFTDRHVRLYDLIRRRFLASQMKAARYDQTVVLIEAELDENVSGGIKKAILKSNGSILKFDGWMRLFPAGDDSILPEVSVGDVVHYQEINTQQKFTSPPPRYNDASLVKELEKRGIGRPSTYASIISVIEERGYVDRDGKRFIATPIGMTVNDFLVEYFKTIMDYDFTAEMEEDLDRIARGEKEWENVVKEFYSPLAKKIENVKEHADRMQIPVEKTGEKCPTCGETEKGDVVIRTGKYGKFYSCSRYPDCDYTKNFVETLGDQKCPLCQQGDVVIKNSRWGKQFYGCGRYPECDWASWQKPEPGLKITAAEWAEQQAAREQRKKKRAALKSNKAAKSGSKKAKSTTKKKAAKKSVASKKTTTAKKAQ